MHLGWVLAWFALGCLLLSTFVFPLWWRGRVARATVLSRAWIGRARIWWLSTLLLLVPALLVWGWMSWRPHQAEAFDDSELGVNWQVSQLLRGEQLVPPPPLPPEAFATPEVEVLRPMLSSADRRWERMDEGFVQALLRVFKVMKEVHGYDMALLEGYRSPQRQAVLWARGPNVTGAAPGQSYHQHGLAADCAFMRDGRLVISERDPWAMRGYQLYGQVAEQHGLTWGGRWRLMDFGHVELRKPGLRLPKATQLVTADPS
jgi:peptidoglycan L-alanyl-D-glutamate endopeptidase CwlK